MSRLESSQERNKRHRPTRVDISYTLHLPNGTQVQERLPFVLGVMADLSGDEVKDADLKDTERKFHWIHKDNFDEILAKLKPGLKYTVPDTLRGEGLLQVDLQFRGIDDFHPDQIVQRVPQLKAQQERRKRLENLLSMLGSDPRLEARLQEIVDDPAKRSLLLARIASLDAGGSEQ
jgi:type VI secretion system protein ImpB